MLGDFCKEERGMAFEESYEVQGMFLGDGGAVEGVEISAKEEEGAKGVGESKVREV
jgi:NCS1 family nucleobase:cation symporter-1